MLAIAITLLVLEISVPPSQFHDLWRGIANQWPSYLAYATSFLTIGSLWLVHHAIFRRLITADGVILRLNLLLLMTVSFLPFPTKLMAEALHEHAGERQAVLFYGGCLFVITSLITGMARYATRQHLLGDLTSREEVRQLVKRTAPSLGFYLPILLLALVAPKVAVIGFLVVAVQAVIRVR